MFFFLYASSNLPGGLLQQQSLYCFFSHWIFLERLQVIIVHVPIRLLEEDFDQIVHEFIRIEAAAATQLQTSTGHR